MSKRTALNWGIAFLFFVILFALSTGGSAWAAPGAQGTVPPPPPPPPPAPVGSTGGTFSNGPASVTFPAGAVPDGSRLTIQQANLNGLPATGGFRLGSSVYQFSLVGPNGTPITSFSQNIQVCFTLSAADVAALGSTGPVIQWWNAATGNWENQTTTPGAQANQFCTSVNHLSIYGIFTQGVAPAPVAASTDANNWKAILPLALALVGVLALGAIWLRRPKR